MKHPKRLLTFLFICSNLVLSAQTVTIKVDTVYGCDPTTVKLSYTTTLDPITSVLWNFGNSSAASSDSSPTTQYVLAGDYNIKLKINDTDSATIPITIGACTQEIDAPNVFTPNGDNINDEFKVEYNGNKVISLKVFTRSGIMILDTQGIIIRWDGKLDTGEPVLPGIYYYIAEVKDASPPKIKKGFFYVFY